ncbi:uncharacterized protein LOC130892764 isoform X1 [Diorhabda carinulata]|uniref:uncharacterized protein LOC130892764 isoform X1 n=1 Tax=Diorhabda carinulata TaxID=1163345 RepID=UPI0025A027C1|nr:uncharacterized protein LOC130892764 isoform X1 [Diorhabda carinulata]
MWNEDVCRLCLSNKELVCVFENQKNQVNNLKQIVFVTTGVEILENDVVSRKICDHCRKVVLKMIEFREKSLQTDLYHKDQHARHSEQLERKNARTKNIKNTIDCESMKKSSIEPAICKVRNESIKPAIYKKAIRIHPSVSRLRTTYPKIKIPKKVLRLDVNPEVNLKSDAVKKYFKEKNLDLNEAIGIAAKSTKKTIETERKTAKKRCSDDRIAKENEGKRRKIDNKEEKSPDDKRACRLCGSVRTNAKKLKEHNNEHFRCRYCRTECRLFVRKQEHEATCLVKESLTRKLTVALKRIDVDKFGSNKGNIESKSTSNSLPLKSITAPIRPELIIDNDEIFNSIDFATNDIDLLRKLLKTQSIIPRKESIEIQTRTESADSLIVEGVGGNGIVFRGLKSMLYSFKIPIEIVNGVFNVRCVERDRSSPEKNFDLWSDIPAIGLKNTPLPLLMLRNNKMLLSTSIHPQISLVSIPPKISLISTSIHPQTSFVSKPVPPQTSFVSKPVPPQTSFVSTSVPPQSSFVSASIPPQTSFVSASIPPQTSFVSKPVPPQTSFVSKPVPPQTSFVSASIPPQSSFVSKPVPPQTSFVSASIPPQTSFVSKSVPPQTSFVSASIPPQTSFVSTSIPPQTSFVSASIPPQTSFVSTSIPPQTSFVSASIPPQTSFVSTSIPPQTSFVSASIPPQTSFVSTSIPPQTSFVSASIPPQTSFVSTSIPPQTSFVSASIPPQTSFVSKSVPPQTSFVSASIPPQTSFVSTSIPPQTSFVSASIPPQTSFVSASIPPQNSLDPRPAQMLPNQILIRNPPANPSDDREIYLPLTTSKNPRTYANKHNLIQRQTPIVPNVARFPNTTFNQNLVFPPKFSIVNNTNTYLSNSVISNRPKRTYPPKILPNVGVQNKQNNVAPLDYSLVNNAAGTTSTTQFSENYSIDLSIVENRNPNTNNVERLIRPIIRVRNICELK